MRVRLEDVAAEAGVSTITVSRCFNNPERVSKATRAHVLAIASRMNYIGDRLASSLGSARTKTVAVILPTISNPIHSETLQGITDVLTPAGYQILVGDDEYSTEREAELVRLFLSYRADGLVLTGLTHTAECVTMIRSSGTPVVETLDMAPDCVDMAVGFSNYEAGRTITRHLLDRGRRRIAFVGHAVEADSRSAARRAGFLSAIAEASEARATEIIDTASTTDESQAQWALRTILERAPETDAILFVGHLSAAAAIRHAHDIKIAVPERLAIAGMGDSPVASWTTPSLTTVRFPQREIGAAAAGLLLARFEDRKVKSNVVDLGYQLMVREST